MKIKVLKNFRDKKNPDKGFKAGTIIDMADERANEIIKAGFAEKANERKDK